ncbi:MAG: SMC-Scp complex subunit ScpB [Planctomycetota bacterium]
MDKIECKKIIEALLFVSDSPISLARMQNIIVEADKPAVKDGLSELIQEYESDGRAARIQEIAGGYQLLTRPDYTKWLERLKTTREEGKLSAAALETLSIIGYKQPVIRAEIESIRGVDSSAIVRGLMEKGLVKISGRAETLGHPILYGTTDKFLELLGLASIKDLPKPVEMK